MTLRIEERDLLSMEVDAVFVPIDGEIGGTPPNVDRCLGSVGHQIMRRYPDAELDEEVASQVSLPLHLGRAALIELPEGVTPFRFACVLSMLPHTGDLTAGGLANACRGAFAHALEICRGRSLARVATPLLSGGWRLPPETAMIVMLDVLRRPGVLDATDLCVCVRDGAGKLRARAESALGSVLK